MKKNLFESRKVKSIVIPDNESWNLPSDDVYNDENYNYPSLTIFDGYDRYHLCDDLGMDCKTARKCHSLYKELLEELTPEEAILELEKEGFTFNW